MRIWGLLLLMISLPAMTDTQLTTQIYDIDYGGRPGEDILILLTSGHVAKINHHQVKLLNQLSRLKKSSLSKAGEEWLEITLDQDRFIKAVKKTQSPFIKESNVKKFFRLNSSYVPTTIADMSKAQSYHQSGRRNPKDSQCFNRAMVWSYEWWRNHSLRSMKILIFFTRTYIRRYNFEWWFHIAPYVHVMDEGKVVERVMDLKYTRGPIEFRRWTDIFMRNDAECKVITRYSDYADYPYTGQCYLMRTNMYTYQPADLEMHEAWGYTKDRFHMDEVRGAYLEAFDMSL